MLKTMRSKHIFSTTCDADFDFGIGTHLKMHKTLLASDMGFIDALKSYLAAQIQGVPNLFKINLKSLKVRQKSQKNYLSGGQKFYIILD